MSQKRGSSRKDIEVKVRLQVNAEEKAYRFVERLALVDSITEDEVAEMINAITPAHYADIVEERTASRFCGYPLCNKRLEKTLQKKYQISLKTNRVYDLTERKLFCSNFCFKASKWLEQQVPTSPLTNRNETVKVDLLHKEDDQNKRSDKVLGPDVIIGDLVDDVAREDIPTSLVTGNAASLPESTVINHTKTEQAVESTKTPVQIVRERLQEWFTKETRNIIEERQSFRCLENKIKGSEKPRQEDAMARTIEEDTLSDQFGSHLTFKDVEAPNDQHGVVIPPLDHKAQQLIRRKIVGGKLKQSLAKILPQFGLELSIVSMDLSLLLKSFRFSNQNILLSPKEWKLLSVLLLQIISTFSICIEEILKINNTVLDNILQEMETDNTTACEVIEHLLSNCLDIEPESYKDMEELD